MSKYLAANRLLLTIYIAYKVCQAWPKVNKGTWDATGVATGPMLMRRSWVFHRSPVEARRVEMKL